MKMACSNLTLMLFDVSSFVDLQDEYHKPSLQIQQMLEEQLVEMTA
jgi:hypothetical protein